MAAKVTVYAYAANAIAPRERLTVSKWADRNRIMPNGERWRTARNPLLREIMDGLSSQVAAHTITVRKCCQIGVTELAINWIGYIIKHNPEDILMVQPTLKMVDSIDITRLRPLFESNPDLCDAIGGGKQRDGSNTRAIKRFSGGVLQLASAQVGSSFRQITACYIICDEVDDYPADVEGEGSPLALAAARQTTYPHRKTLRMSSPKIKDASMIDEDFLAGDQRYYYVPCPHCSQEIILRWEMLQWNKTADGEVTAAWYVCEVCGCEIDEGFKMDMLEKGRWKATSKPKRKGHRSYHINGLYYPVGLGLEWKEMAQEWIDAQKNPLQLKAFINTRLGEPWEDQSRDLKPHHIMERAEEYKTRTIPSGCLILTAGIDTQDDRMAVHITGFGPTADRRDFRSWVIDYIEIPGDPARLLRQAKKKEGALYDYLAQTIVNKYGVEMRLSSMAIDSGGHHTHDVYNFTRAHPLPHIMAIKGASRPGRQILAPRPSAQDVTSYGRTILKGVMLWMVGSDTAKHWVHGCLTGDSGKMPEERLLRFPADLELDYYTQLLGEVFDPEKNRWVKRRGRRNEVLDCLGYSVAASQHPEVRVHRMRKRDWDNLERVLQPAEPKAVDPVTEEVIPPHEPTPKQPKRKARLPKRVNGFAQSW